MLDANALAALSKLKTTIVKDKVLYTGTAKGSQGRFGFITCDQSGNDYFVPPLQMDKILPGDQVEFEPGVDNNGKSFATVTRLIQSHLKQFVGQYQIKGNAHLVSPEDNSISRSFFVAPKDRKGSNQDYVVAQVTRHPFADGKPQAKITKVIGNKGSAYLEHELTKTRFGLSEEFPLSVSQQADLCNETHITACAKERLDLTKMPFVTIDGATTKDMDDALFAEKTDIGFRLSIAIADPAALIAPNSAMDIDARLRATSTYLPGQTIHMLPPRMAQNLCSLVQGFDRLALVLRVDLTESGDVTDFAFDAAVIKSQAKLSYDTVNTWLQDPKARLGLTAPVRDSLSVLSNIADVLRERRTSDNVVMPDRDDFRFGLDDMGKILNIVVEPRSQARSMVEECMLLANQLGARFLANHKTGLFSTQAGFRKERLADIAEIIATDLPDLASLDLEKRADFIQLFAMAPQQNPALFQILLKSLTRAEILTEAKPHFAQGFDGYATLTSPIRRYVDLVNHRLIHDILQGNGVSQADTELAHMLQTRVQQSRQAANVVEQWLKCLYMDNFKGVEFEGIVNFINGIGFGVQLPHNGVDGFVSFKGLSPKHQFDGKRLQHQVGERTVTLGMTVRVVPIEADMDRKQVQFNWLDHPANSDAQNPEQPAAAVSNDTTSDGA